MHRPCFAGWVGKHYTLYSNIIYPVLPGVSISEALDEAFYELY